MDISKWLHMLGKIRKIMKRYTFQVIIGDHIFLFFFGKSIVRLLIKKVEKKITLITIILGGPVGMTRGFILVIRSLILVSLILIRTIKKLYLLIALL